MTHIFGNNWLLVQNFFFQHLTVAFSSEESKQLTHPVLGNNEFC